MEIKYELVSMGNGVESLLLGNKATGFRIKHDRLMSRFEVSGGGKLKFVRRRAQATKAVVSLFERAVRAKK
ncbi:hypothetical protein CH54_1422 [Yersinia rochesterensis]|uniref:Phage protein n=1 Tax=Yersinia rochesterensis TaxID=1604335 RepID=A0ABM5SLG7_9GAMM|nr:hypothetical protein [Yersinia rochesterensis]AIN19580.1 hypothetical protein DJ57_2269 [Yersinia rochesterensis]AJI86058.1 hypothetical protein AW19_242 [Yersinia frederiksenii Y225]AJJ35260.1 hypothetical protein CH54_1422 [Yersinia rochesterensis]